MTIKSNPLSGRVAFTDEDGDVFENGMHAAHTQVERDGQFDSVITEGCRRGGDLVRGLEANGRVVLRL